MKTYRELMVEAGYGPDAIKEAGLAYNLDDSAVCEMCGEAATTMDEDGNFICSNSVCAV